MIGNEEALRGAAALIEFETALLRTRQFSNWLDLFTPDGTYWLPVTPEQTDPFADPSHIYETRPALDARVERLCDPRVLSQTPVSRVSRLLGRPWLIRVADGCVEVAVTFHVVESRAASSKDESLRIFAGEARYCMVPDEQAAMKLRIKSKRVDLVNSESAFFGVSILL